MIRMVSLASSLDAKLETEENLGDSLFKNIDAWSSLMSTQSEFRAQPLDVAQLIACVQLRIVGNVRIRQHFEVKQPFLNTSSRELPRCAYLVKTDKNLVNL